MTFTAATYPDVVRDLLTWLTQGVVAEPHPVPSTGLTELRFGAGPVRRISHLSGAIQVDDRQVPYRFTDRDFELLADTGESGAFSGVRFGRGKLPAPGSTLTVNYFPSRTGPVPLNDVAVGSVVRTLLETVAREVATMQSQLELVYDSAFVETATGSSLDRVAALVDVRRLRQRHPIGQARFARRPGSAGAVTIPVETAVTDGQGTRYLTTDPAHMLPSQTTVEVWVHGESAATDAVEAGALTVLERAIAGVDSVVNDAATFRATEEETDTQLRRRATAAIHRAGRGTLDSIRAGVEALDFVSAVTLREQVDGVPGTLHVDVALTEDTVFTRQLVQDRVDELRAAGIAATTTFAGRLPLSFDVSLTLTGPTALVSVVDDVLAQARQRLGRVAGSVAPGATLRRARLVAALLEDERIIDAAVVITAAGVAVAGDTFVIPNDSAVQLDIARDVTFRPVAFEAGGDDQPATVPVDVRLRVAILDAALAPAAVEARATVLLETVVANAPALTTDTVATAIADETGFVALAEHTVVAIETGPGQFTEVRPGDAAYTAPSGRPFELRTVTAITEGATP